MQRPIKKTFATLIGFIVVGVGIIMIPYPGPGWLVVFVGLGILSTEYEWARRLLNYTKQKYEAWVAWVKRQKKYVQLLINLSTLAVVVLTVWIVNGYGIIDHALGLDLEWVDSPLPVFH